MTDEDFLRRSFAVARDARAAGHHPFGAILVGPDGTILMEQGNGFAASRDMTAHAERVLMTRASQAHAPAFLRGCTMYTSAEPCAMCAGAAYWAGVGRVVYGLGERELRSLTGDHAENPTLDLPCRTIFAAGQRHVEVVGPLLAEEAAAVHSGVWDRSRSNDPGPSPLRDPPENGFGRAGEIERMEPRSLSPER